MRYNVVLRGKLTSRQPNAYTVIQFITRKQFFRQLPVLLEYSDIIAAGIDETEAARICAGTQPEQLFQMALQQSGKPFSVKKFLERVREIEAEYGVECPSLILDLAQVYTRHTMS
jgi:hypothetical protein